jgi:type IV secretory pathway TrbF-like protein
MATPLKHTPAYEDQLTAWHNRRLWYLLCGAGAVIAVLIVVLCIVTLRPRTPYVIEVDKKGEPLGTVQPFLDLQTIPDNMLRYDLGEYVQQAFGVSRSFDQNKMQLSEVYAMSTGQASQALTAYYRANHEANNPLVINTKCWQGVRIVRVLKLPAPSTYQVDYVLDRHDNNGSFTGVQTNWRATMRIVRAKPTNNNLLGIFVTDLDFEPEAK